MCCSKVMNKMYLVQWLDIPYIPLYLSKIRSLIPIFQKRPRNTHGKEDFDRLFSSDPFISPLYQQNPFPNIGGSRGGPGGPDPPFFSKIIGIDGPDPPFFLRL